MTSLTFQNTTFDIIDRSGQPWLKAADIARALGYAAEDAVSRIYRRNSDEFTSAMTETVNLTASGNLQNETRIFSPRGCYALAMFARTATAKEFRKWVLDVLEGKAAPATAPAAIHQQRGEILAEALQHGRWFLTTLDGRIILSPINPDAFVITPDKLARVLREPNEVPIRLLPEIIEAAAGRLRAYHAQHK